MANFGFIEFNGKKLPNPRYGFTIERQQLVDAGRNAKGEFVGAKVNRRQIKLIIEFPHLTANEWGEVLNMIEGFIGNVTVYDPLRGRRATYEMYWGDSSETVFKVDPNTNYVTEYINCKCNLIDTGKPFK